MNISSEMPPFSAINIIHDSSETSSNMGDTASDTSGAAAAQDASAMDIIEDKVDMLLEQRSSEEEITGEAIPKAAQKYSRPATTDSSDWWFCPIWRWNELLRAVDDAVTKKNALNQLRKIHVSGRLMESEEGQAAVKGCDECGKKGVKCMLPVDEEVGNVCAYCTRNSRPRCNGTRKEVEQELSAEERLAVAESKIMALEMAIREMKVEQDRQRTYRSAVDQWNGWAFEKINQLCDFAGISRATE